MDERRLGAIVLLVGVLVLVMAGMAAAQTLHAPQVGTVAQCDGLVTWHFVHNRMEATSGTIRSTFLSAGSESVSNGPPFESNSLHYRVETPSGDTLRGATDNVPGGNLLLSHWTCDPTSSSLSALSSTPSS